MKRKRKDEDGRDEWIHYYLEVGFRDPYDGEPYDPGSWELGVTFEWTVPTGGAYAFRGLIINLFRTMFVLGQFHEVTWEP